MSTDRDPLIDEIVDARRAHDADVAKLREELRESRDRALQLERELARARDELDEIRMLATEAIEGMREELADATDVATAALAALAGQEVLCDGSGTRRAHAVVGGRVQRVATPHPCPGCAACRNGGDDREEVRHG